MNRSPSAPLGSGLRRNDDSGEGPTQNARVLSEAWVAAQMFCPNCGADRLHALHHPPPPAIVIPGGGERSEPEARNPAARVSATRRAARSRQAVGSAGA